MVSVDELRRLRRSFQESAELARELQARLQQESSQGVWHSNAASQFRAEWDVHRRNLARLQDDLERLSHEVAAAASVMEAADRPV